MATRYVYTYAVTDAETGKERAIKIIDKEGRDWIAGKKVHMLIDLAYDGRATAVLVGKEMEETK